MIPISYIKNKLLANHARKGSSFNKIVSFQMVLRTSKSAECEIGFRLRRVLHVKLFYGCFHNTISFTNCKYLLMNVETCKYIKYIIVINILLSLQQWTVIKKKM